MNNEGIFIFVPKWAALSVGFVGPQAASCEREVMAALEALGSYRFINMPLQYVYRISRYPACWLLVMYIVFFVFHLPVTAERYSAELSHWPDLPPSAICEFPFPPNEIRPFFMRVTISHRGGARITRPRYSLAE